MSAPSRYDRRRVYPTEMIRRDLQRTVAQAGVTLRFIAELAGMSPKTLVAINSGRRTTCTMFTVDAIAGALEKIDRGRVEIPDSARRDKRLPLVQKKNAETCGRDHPYDEANTGWRRRGDRLQRYCKKCQGLAVKRYQVKVARGLA